MRFVREMMRAVGPDKAASEAEEAVLPFSCHKLFLHPSFTSPGREVSQVDNRVAEGNGLAPGKPLDHPVLSLEDRVREVEKELRHVPVELEKVGKVAAELRTRLAQAEADLKEAGSEEGASGAAAKALFASSEGSWETTEELRTKLREVFDKMDLNKVSGRDPKTLNLCPVPIKNPAP